MKKRYLVAGATGVVAGAVATKLLTRPRDVSWPNSLDFIYHPEFSWFTTVEGARIHYHEAGDEKAPPLILIHGFISSNSIWSGVLLSFSVMAVSIRALARTFNVFEILAIRNAAGLAILLALACARPSLRASLVPRRMAMHALRNSVHFAAQYAWALSITLLPLATVFALEFTNPAWLALLAA